MNKTQQKWYDAMREKGHTPRMDVDFGGLNMFFCDEDVHNGPGCETCYWSTCEHCNRKMIIPSFTKPEEWS